MTDKLGDDHLATVILRPLPIDGQGRLEELRRSFEKAEFAGDLDTVFRNIAETANQRFLHPLTVELDDMLVGFLLLRTGAAVPEWAVEKSSTIHNFLIAEQYAGQGIGKRVIELLLQRIADKDAGIEKISLSVNCRNEAATVFYLSNGFSDTGRRIAGRLGEQMVLQRDVQTPSRPPKPNI